MWQPDRITTSARAQWSIRDRFGVARGSTQMLGLSDTKRVPPTSGRLLLAALRSAAHYRLLTIGRWLQAAHYLLSTTGRVLLAACCWPPTADHLLLAACTGGRLLAA